MSNLELEKLRSSLVTMGEMSEYSVMAAVTALIDRNAEIAAAARAYDDEIDEMELSIDRQCRDLLGAGKLDAPDIDFVLSAHKTNNDLERIGDNAVQIAEHVKFLVAQNELLTDVLDFLPMFEQVAEMARESITALLEQDAKLSWKIADEQPIVNDYMQLIFREVVAIMRRSPALSEGACHLLFIAQALRRIADLAVNIAEEVVFTVEGKTIRHHLGEYRPLAIDLLNDDFAPRSDYSDHPTTHAERQRLIKERAKKIQTQSVRHRAGQVRIDAFERKMAEGGN